MARPPLPAPDSFATYVARPFGLRAFRPLLLDPILKGLTLLRLPLLLPPPSRVGIVPLPSFPPLPSFLFGPPPPPARVISLGGWLPKTSALVHPTRTSLCHSPRLQRRKGEGRGRGAAFCECSQGKVCFEVVGLVLNISFTKT